MHRLVLIFLTGLAVSAQSAPKVGGILNGASFRTPLCPGTLASLFGSNLASTTASAQSVPLATELEGTKVLVQDPSMPGPIAAPLYFVSPGQINFQIPFEVVRSSITVTVSTPQGNSDPYKINLDPMAPGIFSKAADGIGDALVFDTDFKLLTRTPDVGSTIILYSTGLGSTTPAAKSGSGGSVTPPLTALKAVPLPNSPPNGVHSYYTVTGKFTPGSTFVMDSTNNLDLLVFAAFGSIPYPTSDVPISVALYIDGQMVDAATSTYKRP